MKSKVSTGFDGLFELEMFHAGDDRGMFVKPLHAPTLTDWGLESHYPESFYSHNKRGVVRGMHFQHPPHDHAKIVYCSRGALIDVVVDLRKNSATFKQVFSAELSENNFKALYIPRGFAHGFCVLEDDTTMVYFTSTVHHPKSDGGLLWNSIPFDWPEKVAPFTHSERDLTFPTLNEFNSPF